MPQTHPEKAVKAKTGAELKHMDRHTRAWIENEDFTY